MTLKIHAGTSEMLQVMSHFHILINQDQSALLIITVAASSKSVSPQHSSRKLHGTAEDKTKRHPKRCERTHSTSMMELEYS